MSLINDALKRAKQAQKNQPPSAASGPQLRPAAPAPHKSGDLIWFLPLVVFLVMTLAILFVWSRSHKNSQTIAQTPNPATTPQSPAISTKPVEPTPPVTTAAAIATRTSAPVAAPIIAPAPKSAPPRLQAIFYNPQRPSAIINGKTVMIGDQLGELRVVHISKDSATLTSAAQTLVLTLE